MKNKHIGELKVFHEDVPMRYQSQLNMAVMANRMEFSFNLKNCHIDIPALSCDFSLNKKGYLKIVAPFYSETLFTAYLNKSKILSIEEKGKLIDTEKSYSDFISYVRVYKNYKIKSISMNEEKGWTYIFKPCFL